MRSNRFRAAAVIGVVATLVCRNASMLAQDIDFSHMADLSVRLVSYSEPAKRETGALRAAFLSDELVDSPQEPHRLAPSIPQVRSQAVQWTSGADCGATCENGTCAACNDGSCGLDITRRGTDILNNGSDYGACDSCPTGDCEFHHLDETCEGPGSVYYAEVQIMWLRAHVMEDAVGKLSEQYNWSPRIIAGYENASGIGARGRFWHYSHETPILGSNDEIGFRFDTIDLEGTARFAMRKADLVVFGGFRWANLEIEWDDDWSSTSAPGLTAGADARIEVCRKCNSQWAGIGGFRFSTLGGDWEGSSSGFVSPVRDDNIVVQEIYGGVEYTHVTEGGYNLYARLTLEVQNWHSDAMSQLSGTDSIGFVGPGIHAGASF